MPHPAAPPSRPPHIPCRPFVKWVGGKRQLLEQLGRRMPKSLGTFFEPFVGGGAFFFHLQPEDSVLMDINPELINCYRVIRDDVEALIRSLREHENSETYFYEIRAIDRTEQFSRFSALARASRFIYLNKTAYNGLWRVNAKGQHNVPFGRYKNPRICDEDNLRACSAALKSVKSIETAGYLETEALAQAGDFVYFDPPYHPLNPTSSFTSYAKDGFTAEDQIRLKELIDRLSARDVRVMLSNSSAPLIIDLYSDGYRLDYVDASRAVNCRAEGRGPVKEVIVTNYL